MQTFTQFRLPDGSVIELVDWVDKPVYSTGEFLTGFTDEKVQLFTYTAGSDEVVSSDNATVRRAATEKDTNVAAGGGNVASEELLVYAIKPEMFELQLTTANSSTDLTTAAPTLDGQPMMRTSVLKLLHMEMILRLRITQKGYAEAGLGYFTTGFDAAAGGSPFLDENGTIRSYAANGIPSQEAVRSFAIPHHIGGTEKYQLELRNYPGSTITFNDESGNALARTMVRMRVYLDGMRKRPTT